MSTLVDFSTGPSCQLLSTSALKELNYLHDFSDSNVNALLYSNVY